MAGTEGRMMRRDFGPLMRQITDQLEKGPATAKSLHVTLCAPLAVVKVAINILVSQRGTVSGRRAVGWQTESVYFLSSKEHEHVIEDESDEDDKPVRIHRAAGEWEALPKRPPMSGSIRERVIEMLDGGQSMSVAELAAALGYPSSKSIDSAINRMVKGGDLDFTMVPFAPNGNRTVRKYSLRAAAPKRPAEVPHRYKHLVSSVFALGEQFAVESMA
jgi:hypothetical protein